MSAAIWPIIASCTASTAAMSMPTAAESSRPVLNPRGEGGFVRGVAAAVLAAIIVGTLYVGREVFVPIALAILQSLVAHAT